MIQWKQGAVKGYGDFNISYSLLQQGSTKLAVIMPGKAYGVEAPLLFYSTSLLFSLGYDVLHINYQYNTDEFNQQSPYQQDQQIGIDVNAVVNEVLNSYHYENFCLLGKSIGTIGLAHLVSQKRFEKALVVWLTPLVTRDLVFQAMLKYRQRSITHIGDLDPVYDEMRLSQIKENNNLCVHVISGVNHSLEFPEDLYQSIQMLEKIIKDIEVFLRKKG